jgi:hypothetical protein
MLTLFAQIWLPFMLHWGREGTPVSHSTGRACGPVRPIGSSVVWGCSLVIVTVTITQEDPRGSQRWRKTFSSAVLPSYKGSVANSIDAWSLPCRSWMPKGLLQPQSVLFPSGQKTFYKLLLLTVLFSRGNWNIVLTSTPKRLVMTTSDFQHILAKQESPCLEARIRNISSGVRCVMGSLYLWRYRSVETPHSTTSKHSDADCCITKTQFCDIRGCVHAAHPEELSFCVVNDSDCHVIKWHNCIAKFWESKGIRVKEVKGSCCVSAC